MTDYYKTRILRYRIYKTKRTEKMVQCIKKRDGRIVPFDYERIQDAIYKATVAVGDKNPELAKTLCSQVLERINREYNDIVNVEEVQDIVESVIMKGGNYSLAKAYILYRNERTKIRETRSDLMKIYESITFKDAHDNDIKRENANIDGDTSMGTMLKYGSEGAKYFNLLSVIKPEISAAHKSGDIHIHDLDFYTLTTTCCQIDLIKLFKGGFFTGHGYLREPSNILTYAALACIAIQSNQNDQHGGQSIPNFDYSMATGIKKTFAKLYRDNLAKLLEFMTGKKYDEDIRLFYEELRLENKLPDIDKKSAGYGYVKEKLSFLSDTDRERILKFTYDCALMETDRQTYQALEALVHNLNTMHSRAGAQVPFSSINYGTDTTAEGRMIIRNILLATEAGLGEGETAIFPIHIFKVKEGVNYNPCDPNYDMFKLACRVSAKRLYPNFSFLDAPYNLKYYKPGHPETEVTYMGCRTRVIANVYDPTREISYGRGNLSFTTIPLPRIAIKAKGDVDLFMEDLDSKIDLVVEQLLQRFEIQGKKKVKNFPFLMGQGIWIDSDKLGPEDEIGEILKHGTMSVGFIGLAECLKSLTGRHHGESEESQKLGLKIITRMRERLDAISQEKKLNFTLLATPAEGTAGRFVKLDRKLFGTISGVTDREYYTNSFHIPVYFPITAFEKIKLEAPYHALTNAGHISYVEMDGDPTQNLEAFEAVIRCMKESGVGYGSINHPVDRDGVCGYNGIIGDKCPKCGRTEGNIPFERIRRITGYLVGTLDRFNDAKRAEERDRVKHV